MQTTDTAAPLPLSRLRALADADPTRGLHLYREDTDAAPALFRYVDFPGTVAAYLEHFRAQGVSTGLRIVLPFETSAALVFSFFALMGLGAVVLSVKPRMMGIGRDAYLAFLRSISERHAAGHILDAPCLSGLEVPLRRVALPPADTGPLAGGRVPDRDPDQIALVQFSSGSTSTPKGVPITHRMLAQNIAMIQETDRRAPGDVNSSWLPLYHDMGLIGGLLGSMLVGSDLHLTSPTAFLMEPLGWLRHLSVRRITGMAIPNFAIDYCVRAIRNADSDDLQGLRLDSLRFIYLGSEPINIDNLLAFSELLAPFGFRASSVKPCYGMAEAVLMVSCVGKDVMYRVLQREGGGRAISVGLAHPSFEVRVRSEDGAPCAEGELGEIEIRGGSLAHGYFEDDRPFLNQDGFFATGDLGFLDGGELFISGRIGDRFKINAQSYFSSEIEHALDALPFARPGRTAVISTGGAGGTRVVVLMEVSPRDGGKLGSAAKAQVGEVLVRTCGVKVPAEDVLFIRPGQIERTSSGKIRRHAVAEALEMGRIRVFEDSRT